MANLKNTIINDTQFLQLPKGTTAQRPLNPSFGMMRFNTTFSKVEFFDGEKWIFSSFLVDLDSLELFLDASDPISYPGSGNTWFDISGNGRNGTIINNVGFNSSLGEGSFVFSNSNHYIDLTSIAIPSIWNSNFTGIFWIRWTGTVTSGIFGFQGSPSNFHFEIRSPNAIRLRDRNMSDIVVSNVLTTNTWLQLSFTRTGDTYRVYVNGNQVGSRTQSPGNVTFNQNPTIGESHWPIGARPFAGAIATAQFYSKAFSAEDIQNNYEIFRNRFGV